MGLKQGDNPHIWYNLNMPKKYVDYLVKTASEIDPKHAAYFKSNAASYLQKIDSIKKIAAKINGREDNRFMLVSPCLIMH